MSHPQPSSVAYKDDQPQPAIWALVGCTLIDGTGRPPVRDATVVIAGSQILAAGPRGEVALPPGARRVDAVGKTVLPGLIDCHTHVSMTTLDVGQRLFEPKTVEIFRTAGMLKRTLHAGFTTVRETGLLNDPGFRTALAEGLIEGPRLILAGGLGQTGGPFDEYFPRGIELAFYGVERGDGVAGVQLAARRLLRQGFDQIKVCVTGAIDSAAGSPDDVIWTADELCMIVSEAAGRGKVVAAHAENLAGVKLALRCGVWSVEHGCELDDEALELFLATGATLVPTLFVMDELLNRGADMGLAPQYAGKVQRVAKTHIASFRRAVHAGVRIALGTDAIDEKMHGRNARELELMVRHGLAPLAAITAGTRTGAEVCRVADVTGVVAAGKLADLLVIAGDPLADIAILQDRTALWLVLKEGKPASGTSARALAG